MPAKSGNNPTLAIIVVVVVVLLGVFAWLKVGGVHTPPSGHLAAPVAAPDAAVAQPSTVPNAQQPASQENGAQGHKMSPNEPGGPAATANTVGAP